MTVFNLCTSIYDVSVEPNWNSYLKREVRDLMFSSLLGGRHVFAFLAEGTHFFLLRHVLHEVNCGFLVVSVHVHDVDHLFSSTFFALQLEKLKEHTCRL